MLAGASTGEDGQFRLPVSLDMATHYQFFVLQLSDLDNTALEAMPGPGATLMGGRRIVYENSRYRESILTVASRSSRMNPGCDRPRRPNRHNLSSGGGGDPQPDLHLRHGELHQDH